MVKKSLIWTYRATLGALWLMIVILTLSVLTLRYAVLPNIEHYKDRIAESLSQNVGRKITIGTIDASWNGMNPHLSLRQVTIYDAENRLALTLHEIETSLSWLSIPLLEPKLASLTIQGPVLSIRREADGSMVVAGIRLGGDAKPTLANWALRQSRIDIVDATILWQDDLRKAPALTLNDVRLTIENPLWDRMINRHQFAMHAIPSTGSSHPVDLRANLYGADLGNLNEWHGTIYGRMDGTDIAAWRQWVDYPVDLNAGYGAARFWFEFSKGAADRLTADVMLQKVQARIAKDRAEAKLNSLAGRLIWSRHADGQSFNLERLKLATADGLKLENGSFSFRERRLNGADIVEGTARLDEINLASINTFSDYLPLSENTVKLLTDLSPAGIVSNLDMRWKGNRNKFSEYALNMQFKNLGIQAYKEIPGFSNLSGKLNANEKQGTMSISSQQATLDFKGVMRWPIPAEKLTGMVKWTNHAKGTDVRVTNLAISGVHLAGTVNASYKHGKSSPAHIELNGKFERANAQFARFYYPIVLGKETLDWLDSSIISGEVTDTHVIVNGRVDQFPFPNPEHGLFKVTAKLKNGVLDYANHWPKIEKLNLDMLFQGSRMELNANAGNILGHQLKTVKAIIPVLDADNPVLEVSGETEGAVSDAIKFVNNSPVRELTDGITNDMLTTGTGKLKLELKIPLEDVDATRIKGIYQIKNGSMSAPSIPDFTGINGNLEFTESGINAKNIGLYIYGGPATLDINTGKNRLIKIAARGNINDAGLKSKLGNALGILFTGNANWLGDISVDQEQLLVTVRSDLAGMALDLPHPVGKTAEEKMPLRIDLRVEKTENKPKQEYISVSMANQVAAKLLLKEVNGAYQVDRGEIGINVLPEIPPQPGLELRGEFDQLNIDQWLAVVEKTKKVDGNNDSLPFPIQRINVTANRLDVFERRINALKLNAKQAENGWQMQIQSLEMNGDVQWDADDNGRIVARLKNLTVPNKAPLATNMATESKPVAKKFEYPDLDIISEAFTLGKKALGKLELKASEKNDNWRINQLKISNADNILTADGEWHNWRRNPNTQMNVNWEINQLGNTLTQFGHPDVIKDGKAKLSGRLRWPGSPHEFNVSQLTGDIKLDARNGEILQIKPGVGRLFSVLTLQNLPRRLTFDFRDVLRSGFTFDKITSTANINQGVMRSNDFLLEGPAAKIEIKGETDLNKETQHLHILVTPFISDSVSLAALAGGPAVAAAAFVAQKLLKEPLNKFASEEYEIVGTWDNPVELKQEKVTDEPVKGIPGQ